MNATDVTDPQSARRASLFHALLAGGWTDSDTIGDDAVTPLVREIEDIFKRHPDNRPTTENPLTPVNARLLTAVLKEARANIIGDIRVTARCIEDVLENLDLRMRVQAVER